MQDNADYGPKWHCLKGVRFIGCEAYLGLG